MSSASQSPAAQFLSRMQMLPIRDIARHGSSQCSGTIGRVIYRDGDKPGRNGLRRLEVMIMDESGESMQAMFFGEAVEPNAPKLQCGKVLRFKHGRLTYALGAYNCASAKHRFTFNVAMCCVEEVEDGEAAALRDRKVVAKLLTKAFADLTLDSMAMIIAEVVAEPRVVGHRVQCSLRQQDIVLDLYVPSPLGTTLLEKYAALDKASPVTLFMTHVTPRSRTLGRMDLYASTASFFAFNVQNDYAKVLIYGEPDRPAKKLRLPSSHQERGVEVISVPALTCISPTKRPASEFLVDAMIAEMNLGAPSCRAECPTEWRHTVSAIKAEDSDAVKFRCSVCGDISPKYKIIADVMLQSPIFPDCKAEATLTTPAFEMMLGTSAAEIYDKFFGVGVDGPTVNYEYIAEIMTKILRMRKLYLVLVYPDKRHIIAAEDAKATSASAAAKPSLPALPTGDF